MVQRPCGRKYACRTCVVYNMFYSVADSTGRVQICRSITNQPWRIYLQVDEALLEDEVK